jgi:hypothetical protein
MRRTHVHLPEDVFDACDGFDGEAAEVSTEYASWVCSACGLQQRYSAQGAADVTVDSGATVRFIEMKFSD